MLINIRLLTPVQDKVAVQESMIMELHKVVSQKPSKYTILGGDFNFVERNEDTTGPFVPVHRPCWERLKEDLGIHDCTSDVHSFFHKPSTGSSSWSTRIDRFYVSYTEADLAIIKPVVSSDLHSLINRGELGFNAHVPTSLVFFPRMKEASGRRRIGDSTVENPNFAIYTKKFFDNLLKSLPDAGPMVKLKFLTDAMHKASNKIFRENKHVVDKVVLFQRAVTLLRHLSSEDPDDATSIRLIRGTPLRLLFLSRNDDDYTWNTTKLREYINNAFKVAGVPEGNGEFIHGNDSLGDVGSTPAAPPAPKKANALKELKLKLPSTRTKIVALRPGPDTDPSCDPEVIGPIIQGYYGKIWRALDALPERPNVILDYLEDYDRRIDPSKIIELSLELVLKAIQMAPDTSPGPDGVPFAAFKANASLAGPIILEVCIYLGIERGADDLDGFNFATLFLIPKKETLEVGDTRPICVNNAGNRLVARVLFLAMVDASQELIGHYQKMFLPGRKMTDHLFDLNEDFYQSVLDGDENFILFTDNAKAFDSLFHDFIKAVLKWQGFPSWCCNIVANLLTAVKVSPSLAPDFIINIGRGVKQGCPLSPLLFILCYDVLHFKLSPLENILVKAAADDLRVKSNSITDIVKTFPVIDCFTRVSGLGINRDKTVILSSEDHLDVRFEPCNRVVRESCWPLVKFVDSHKYLGILFGRKIQVEDIFAAPAKKAFDRAMRFSPALSRMDTQRRIITFNVFITPIFSFVQMFYVMPSSVSSASTGLLCTAPSPPSVGLLGHIRSCAPLLSRLGSNSRCVTPGSTTWWSCSRILTSARFPLSSISRGGSTGLDVAAPSGPQTGIAPVSRTIRSFCSWNSWVLTSWTGGALLPFPR
jgi:hypothetical protein